MKPTPEQQIAIETADRALVVEAGAGTGKTWVLVQRFMHLLEANPALTLDNILAITFTEKAAREMRTRLRRAIEQQARLHPDNAQWQARRLNLDRMQVSTIHSLCARILKENSIAAEIDPLFEVLGEQESELLKQETIRATIQTLVTENHPALQLLDVLRVFDLRSVMEIMLNSRGTLQQLFHDLDQPAELLERWKTGLAEMRTALWNAQLHQHPALSAALVSMPNVAISDPQDRLAGTVHMAIKGSQEYAQGNLAAAANSWLAIKLVGGKQNNWGGKEELTALKADLRTLREAAEALEKAGALQQIGVSDKIAAAHLQLWRSLWQLLEQHYHQIKNPLQALDFDDLEILTDRLLHKTQRSERLESYLAQIKHLMVDEFQDTNLIQQRIVYALAPLDQSGKFFAVGDAKQSIYRFRQAQVSVFNHTSLEVEAITGSAPIPLSTSFRTHHSLVQAVNHLFDRILSPLGTEQQPYEAIPAALTAQRKAHPALSTPLEILLLPARDTVGKKINSRTARVREAGWIAQRLLALKKARMPVWDKNENKYRPFEYRDAVVLMRATTQLPLYEAVFKNAGLPYLTVSGRGYYDQPEIQDLIALLTTLANPDDDLNLAAALRSPLFSFSDETLYQLRWHTPAGDHSRTPIAFKAALAQPPANDQPELIERARHILDELWRLTRRVDIWSLLRKALDLTSFEVILARSDGITGRQFVNVQKFLAFVSENTEINLSTFLRHLRDLQAREAREGEASGREPESGAVQLMTIHAAKGLEFPVVVLADMGRSKRSGFNSPYLLHDPAFGLVCKVRDELGDWQNPAGYAWGRWLNECMEEAELRRLLYVACTRAADLLILSGQVGRKDTWLSETLCAFAIEESGPGAENVSFDDFAVRVLRPSEPVDLMARASELSQPGPVSMNTIPALAQPLPVQKQEPPIAVTHLSSAPGRQADNPLELRPALRSRERSPKPERAAGYQLGNIVHKALAHWTCLEYADGDLQQLLRNYALREGVNPSALDSSVKHTHQILMNLKNHTLYQRIQQAQQRHPEVPFSQASPNGPLHGVIDLLFQNKNGSWVLLDWKTEWAPKAETETKSQEHLTQMALYSQALQRTTGLQPEVVLCFMNPVITLVPLSTEKLQQALSG